MIPRNFIQRRWRSVDRFHPVCYIVIVIWFAMAMTGCTSADKNQPSAPPAVVPVGMVESRSLTTFTEYPASIEGGLDIEIRPQVGGYLERVFVEEGAEVSIGQSLFKINEQPFREALNNAQASLHAARAALSEAQLEIDKISPLVENNVVSPIQLKTAQAAYQSAKAGVEQAQAGVASARINLGYTHIKASSKGYIGRIPKKRGSLVSPTDPTPLTRLSEVGSVRVYFSLAENDFSALGSTFTALDGKVKTKDFPKVELVLANDSTYSEKGTIDMIDGQFDKSTGAITLRASFKNATGMLRSGNTGRVRVPISHLNAIVVPQSATVEMQDKIFVHTIAKGNKVLKKPIIISGKSGNNYLIKSGLKPGEEIILSGFDHIQEGQVIRPDRAGKKTANLMR